MKKMMVIALFLLGLSSVSHAETQMFTLSEQCTDDVMSMIRCQVAEGVDTEDAIASMKLRANMLNFKLVSHLPLSEQVKAMGGESNRMEIFQFCDAIIAAQMVKHSLAFAGYLPCRISLVEDDDGQAWLVTLNMDKTMSDASLPEKLRELGLQVRNNIYSIISAGAEGDL